MAFFSKLFSEPITLKFYFDKIFRSFYLSSYRGDKSIPFGKALEKLDNFILPIHLSDAQKKGASIKIEARFAPSIYEALHVLADKLPSKRLRCEFDDHTNGIRIHTGEPNALLKHVSFSREAGKIIARLPKDKVPLSDDNWYLCGNIMYYFQPEPLINRAITDGLADNYLLEFLQYISKWPDIFRHSCPYTYSDLPYITLHIENVSQERVIIRRGIKANATVSEAALPGYVWVADTLHPRQNTSWLDAWFPDGQTAVLEGKFIVLLQQALTSEYRSCISGKTVELAEWSEALPTASVSIEPSSESSEVDVSINLSVPENASVNDKTVYYEPFYVGGTAEESQFKSVPIPPRSTVSDTLPIATPSAHIISDNANYAARRFYEGAIKNVNITKRKAQFVPFFSYWPDYYSMTSDQLSWYFYWRGRVRVQQYPDTDLSYIFLYIYELINILGCDSPMDAYTRMTTLWLNYRAAFPQLDGYMADWVYDFICVHKLEDAVNTANLPCLAGAANTKILDLFTKASVRLDFSDLVLLIDYNIERSKFYQSSNQAICERYMPEIIAVIDHYFEIKKKRRLIDKFKPRKRSESRKVFRSALYALEPQKLRFEWVDIVSNKRLREFLTQVVRYSENSMRELTGFRGRLRGIELDADICHLIDSYLKKKLLKAPARVVAQPIEIDDAKLIQARIDADIIQTLLTVEPEQESVGEPVAASETTSDDRTETIIPERPGDTPEGLLTDLKPVAELLAQLDEGQTALIHALHENSWEASASVLQPTLEDHMLLDGVIDDINSAAINTLDTIIIAREGEIYVTEDDFRDELEFLIDFNAKQKQALLWHAENMDPEWDVFCRQLTTAQISALRLLSKETPAASELQRLAQGVGTLVQPLLDGINEVFMETFDDILLQNSAILPDYIDDLRTLFSEEEAA